MFLVRCEHGVGLLLSLPREHAHNRKPAGPAHQRLGLAGRPSDSLPINFDQRQPCREFLKPLRSVIAPKRILIGWPLASLP